MVCSESLTGATTGTDAGSHDAGSHDAGSHDAGSHDTGSHDAGSHEDTTYSSMRSCWQSHEMDALQASQNAFS